MPIADKMVDMVKGSSLIRKMFEEGLRLKKEFGDDNVYDYSLGNPDVPPPDLLKKTLREFVNSDSLSHGYMPNTGFPHVKQAIADYLNKEYNVNITPELIVVTPGAAGALNDTLRVLLNPGDEIIVPSPYFVGYNQYAFVASGVLKPVKSFDNFHLDLDAIDQAITDKTKVMIINSPNNPTGTVYNAKELENLGELLDQASARCGNRIYLISDEPYRKIAYDVDVPSVFDVYPHTIVLTSYSKELSLAGERIGYMAVHPDAEDADLVAGAAGVANTMMYVNAPALFQRVIGELQGVTVDVSIYRRRRDMLCQGLKEAGYEFEVPEGAFYLFPKSPIKDDVEFIKHLAKENILAVPGTGFNGPGHFRLSYAIPDRTIENSLPGFKRAIQHRFSQI